jgi:hypothetical protein
MADSFDEEHDAHPSVSTNTNSLMSSRTRTAEAQRRSGMGISEPSRESDSEDGADASPRKPYHQTGGLRDRFRTELRSRNRGRAAFGGNKFSRFESTEPIHPRSPVYGDNGNQRGRVVGKDSRQLDRNTTSDISHSDDSDIQTDLAPRRYGEPRLRPQVSETSHRRVSTARNRLVKPRLASSRSDGNDDSDDAGRDDNVSYDYISERSANGSHRVLRGNTHRLEDFASPSTPAENLLEASVLLLKFSSINNHTISKDKTQGEEARNSELLAAFGQRIKAHGFGGVPDELINPWANASPLPETLAPDTGNRSSFPPDPPPPPPSGWPRSTLAPGPPPPPQPWWVGPQGRPGGVARLPVTFRMDVSGLPLGISHHDLLAFASQSNLKIHHYWLLSDPWRSALVDFTTAEDVKTAVERLDGRSLKGVRITCRAGQDVL